MTAIANATLFDATPFPMWPMDTGISSEAGVLRRAARETQNSAEQSQALFGEKGSTIGKIQELVEECSSVGWDGYDGCPISPRTANFANDFIRVLSPSLAMPDISAEPDGEIALEWIASRSKVFSISLGETNRISYAWIDGGDHGHAVAIFDGQKVPRKIVEGIQGAVGGSEAGVRASQNGRQ